MLSLNEKLSEVLLRVRANFHALPLFYFRAWILRTHARTHARTYTRNQPSARIRVIDPFSQMKREYNTILDDADSANRINFVANNTVNKLRQGQLREIIKCFANPVFINLGRNKFLHN